MKDYPERICPVCGLTFKPTTRDQVYDSAKCRAKAHYEAHKADAPQLDQTGLLDEIRRVDAEVASDIEDIAKRAGIQIAEQVLLVCWRAMNRAAVRQAQAVLIEAGQVKPKKRRAPKKAGLV